MDEYTLQQRLQIVQLFYKNNRSYKTTLRALRLIYGRHNVPHRSTIRRLIEKFETTFSLHNVRALTRRRKARSKQNIASVRESVRQDKNLSISRRSQQLGLSQTTVWRILRKDLGLHPYKIKLVQDLKENDHLLRRRFADWALEMLKNDPNFHKKIIFSDECHFWMVGNVNKQNCRIWSDKNPEVIHEEPLHPERLSVWCALHAGGIIGPYFFENKEEKVVTVNGDRYRSMLTDYFWDELDQMEVEGVWFQQDGASSHTARKTINLLKKKFGESIISKNGPVNWPPRSCDITPLDYF